MVLWRADNNAGLADKLMVDHLRCLRVEIVASYLAILSHCAARVHECMSCRGGHVWGGQG